MLIFGLCFVLLFMKLSGRNGFWSRKDDKRLKLNSSLTSAMWTLLVYEAVNANLVSVTYLETLLWNLYVIYFIEVFLCDTAHFFVDQFRDNVPLKENWLTKHWH